MNQEIINDAISKLKSVGLNIFTSIKMSDLPQDIILSLKKQNILLNTDDTLYIIGHGGKDLWSHLKKIKKKEPHPIDNFSCDQMMWFAENVLKEDINILYPNPRYTIPLQALGRVTNISKSSPLGIDINQDFGLWFAFRGVFLSNKSISLSYYKNFKSPCESCLLRPCLRSEVFSSARLSCPYKNEHQYELEQIEYHAANSLKILV